MKLGFFPKLAWDSIRKNSRLYIPYWLTCQLCVCIYYLMRSLAKNPVIRDMNGGSTTIMIMELGGIVIGFFSTVFLFYTNTFLLRRRKREFGLYNVLGMNKSDIGRVLLWEILITAGITLAAGLLIGIVISKLGELILVRMTKTAVQTGLFLSGEAVLSTVVLFAFIYFLLFLNSMRQVRFSSAVKLLKSENLGEKAPKANWVLAVLGLILLGIAYVAAISIRQPLTALLLFFAAVILVIIATYLLMISGSVALCRLLQKKKKYYYKPQHFVSVSSMAYRMKRNGAGLASICILATMVLVMISSTSCLFIGAEDSLRQRYPREFNLEVSYEDLKDTEAFENELRRVVSDCTEAANVTARNVMDLHSAVITALLIDDTATIDECAAEANPLLYEKVVDLFFMDIGEYNRTAPQPIDLQGSDVIICSRRGVYPYDHLAIEGTTYNVVGTLEQFDSYTAAQANIVPTYYILTADLATAVAPLTMLMDCTNTPALKMEWMLCFDTGLDTDAQLTLLKALRDRSQKISCNYPSVNYYGFSCHTAQARDYYSTFGGFFFLGILLSIVFIAAAAVIIYYKQLSEGFEDQGRFAILRKVGMSGEAIRKSIHSQMKLVFLFPLGMAVVHLCFAFPMIRKLLMLFSVNNLPLLIGTASISVAVFALFYTLVYRKTAGVYYRIVSGDIQE